MPRELTLDVRGMEPPEPLARVLEAIDDFVPGDTLTVIIDRMPTPLFRVLERNGYAYRVGPGRDALHEIVIRRRDPAA